MEELARLAETLELSSHLLAGALVLGRMVPLVYLVPFLGGPTLSGTVRFVVAFALTIAIYQVAATTSIVAPTVTALSVLLLKEVLIGACLGLLGAVAFHTLSMAGEIIDQARGTTLARALDPMTGEERSPLSSLHFQLGIVLFLVVGGHRAFLAAVAGSYELVPLGTLPLAPEGVRAVAVLAAEMTGAAIGAALMLAAPAVAAIMLADLALGLLGRTAPQVGTYFMAMPLRAALGLAMVLLVLGAVLPELGAFLGSSVEAVERAAAALGQSPR